MFIAVCILAALPYEIAGQYVQGDSCRQWSAAPAEHTTKGHDSMVVDLNGELGKSGVRGVLKNRLRGLHKSEL
jgi:hypothetical protein